MIFALTVFDFLFKHMGRCNLNLNLLQNLFLLLYFKKI